jgi:hypothetical protein
MNEIAPNVADIVAALRRHGWRIEPPVQATLPSRFAARFAAPLPDALVAWMGTFASCVDPTERAWFVTLDGIRADLERDGEVEVEGFAFDAFERMSMEAAADDALAQAHVEAFWRVHVPLLLSVCGSYQYFALVLAGERHGAVVYGCEPEFEETETVAESLPAFLQRLVDVLDGGDDVAPFSFALPTPGP